MILPSLKLTAITSVVAIAVGFGGGWTARGWKAGSEALDAQTKAIEAMAEGERVGFAAGEAYAAIRTALDDKGSETRTTIIRSYNNVQVPASCAADYDVAISLRNQAIAGNGDAASEPDATLPEDATAPNPAD